MKIIVQFLFIGSLLISCVACGNKRADHAAGDASVYGTVTIPLPWNSVNLRKGEVTTGDFVTDAMMDYVIAHNYTADIAIQNGGGIRGPSDNSGIFPAGGWTGTMIHDLLSFGNVLTIVRTTGAELKSLLARHGLMSTTPIPFFKYLTS
jgi:2',3'-cyclic-nucleotide 2'-phosphodiesterase (5'-nucleotidase family)